MSSQAPLGTKSELMQQRTDQWHCTKWSRKRNIDQADYAAIASITVALAAARTITIAAIVVVVTAVVRCCVSYSRD